MVQRLTSNGVLMSMGLLAWLLAVLFGVLGEGSTAVAFVGAGALLVLVRAFAGRMHGPTTIRPNEVKTNLTPEVAALQETAATTPEPVQADLDTSTLVARWPTLEAALGAIPLNWTKERLVHDDGHPYIHVRTPQAGYELIINTAALDSPAPRWLMIAIAAMEHA